MCDNAWHHIAVVAGFDSGFTCRLYVDDVEEDNDTNSGAWTIDVPNSLVADSHGSFWTNFIGETDQFRIFDRSLTPAEVTDLFEEAP